MEIDARTKEIVNLNKKICYEHIQKIYFSDWNNLPIPHQMNIATFAIVQELAETIYIPAKAAVEILLRHHFIEMHHAEEVQLEVVRE
jgi:hypothetical protein